MRILASRFKRACIRALVPTAIWSAIVLAVVAGSAASADAESAAVSASYLVQPGDILLVSVWREPDMQSEVAVRPDGRISLPLVGEIDVANHDVAQIRADLTSRLQPFMPDAAVNVAVKQPLGNKIYVLGQVNRPGEFILNRDVDVLQALSLAQGATRFAELDEIKVLRREGVSQTAIPFNYDEVVGGKHLEQNIVLRSGDVVVVP